jgi:hypothetical protein
MQASAPPIARLALQTSQLTLTFALCLLVTIFPIAAFFITPMLAIAGHIVLISFLTLYFCSIVPQLVFFALLFQNIFISIFSGYVDDAESFNILKGLNFLTLMVVWLWLFGAYAMRWRDYSTQVNRIMMVGLIAFALIGFYLILGMAKHPMAAVIYLRNILTPMVMFQVFFFVALRAEQPLMPFFTLVTILVIIMGWIEMMDRYYWMDLTNGWTYWGKVLESEILGLAWDKSAKEGQVLLGIVDSMKIDFLNTPLLGDDPIRIIRMNGPNLHAISYAYTLSVLALIMLYSGRGLWVLPLLPLLLLASAKGSMILMFLASCALLGRILFGAVFALISLTMVLIVYFFGGILIGLNIGDFHVLGFMGGVYDFLGNPIGYGLGDGGNLATEFHKLDWSAYQAEGRTPMAMESAVAVMMRQMGIAAFALLACYVWIGFQTFKLSLRSKVSLHSIASFGLFIILVNGVFQEEALFSPLALGTMMALNGHILGSALRSTSRTGNKP